MLPLPTKMKNIDELLVLSNCNFKTLLILIVVSMHFWRKISFVPDWNCALCSPRTEIVGPCNIAAAVDADDLLTSLIGIGVNGVNELPVYIKQTKKPKMSKRCNEKIQLVNNKISWQSLTFTQENKIKYNSSYKMLKIDIRKSIYENELDYEFKKRNENTFNTNNSGLYISKNIWQWLT